MVLVDYLKYIFTTPLSDMTGVEFMLMLVISLLAIAATVYIFVGIFKFLSLVFRGVRNIISAKSKCQHIQCNVCGRTLDRCVCSKNKGRGNASRLHHYNSEQKQKKKAVKQVKSK